MPRSTRQSSVARCSICSMRSSPRNRATPAYFTDHYTKLYVQGAAVADSSTPSDGQPQILLNGSSWRFARSRPWSPARDTSLGTCTMTTIANRLVLLWLRRGPNRATTNVSTPTATSTTPSSTRISTARGHRCDDQTTHRSNRRPYRFAAWTNNPSLLTVQVQLHDR